MLGVVLHQAQGRADDGVGLRGVPAGRLGAGAVEPGAEQADQQQVEQPVEHGLLAGSVADDLVAEQVDERRVELVGAQHQRARERPEQPAGHLALGLVDAGEQHRLPDRAVAPAADALAHLLDHDVAVDGVQT